MFFCVHSSVFIVLVHVQSPHELTFTFHIHIAIAMHCHIAYCVALPHATRSHSRMVHDPSCPWSMIQIHIQYPTHIAHCTLTFTITINNTTHNTNTNIPQPLGIADCFCFVVCMLSMMLHFACWCWCWIWIFTFTLTLTFSHTHTLYLHYLAFCTFIFPPFFFLLYISFFTFTFHLPIFLFALCSIPISHVHVRFRFILSSDRCHDLTCNLELAGTSISFPVSISGSGSPRVHGSCPALFSCSIPILALALILHARCVVCGVSLVDVTTHVCSRA